MSKMKRPLASRKFPSPMVQMRIIQPIQNDLLKVMAHKKQRNISILNQQLSLTVSEIRYYYKEL